MSRVLPGVVVVALAGLITAGADGHATSKSYSTWTLDPQGARVEFRMTLADLMSLRPGVPIQEHLAQSLQLLSSEGVCPATTPMRQANEPAGWIVWRWTVDCGGVPPRAIRSSLDESNLHFVRLIDRQGGVRERVLYGADRLWKLQGAAAGGTGVWGYILLGAKHILAGLDHLAFVMALLLLARSFGEVAGLVTGFTIAHSLTLALAVVGVVRPDSTSVEILIGFSIGLVAAENSWQLAGKRRLIQLSIVGALLAAMGFALAGWGALAPLAWLGLAVFSLCHFRLLGITTRPARLRAVVAFVFGLVHGFGFAGVLMEFELPAARLVPALLGFNVGVELGQLLVVAVVFPLLWLIGSRRQGRWHRLVAEVGSAAIFVLGLYWVLTRAWA